MAKKPNEAFTTVTIKPLSGILDTRSEPEDVPVGAWRWKQNFMLSSGTKLCTRPGFERLFAGSSPYTNFDLHDQGAADLPAPPKEFITLLFEASLNNGQRFLYAGTQSRLYYLDETAGLWNKIGSGFGGQIVSGLAQTRFKAAELSEVILFTNNVDNVLSATVGNPANVQAINALGALNLTAAGVVTEFAGFILLMDVVEDGGRLSSRIWWSDFQKPLVWGIATGSLSNFQDLDYGDQILAAIPMAGALYIFTSKSIWRCTPTGDGNVFSFQRVYNEPLNQAKCLLYPNTLVSTGTACWYASQEAIYYFDPYVPEPVREEWLYRGGAIMFSDQSALDPSCCQSPVAQVKPEDQEIWVSWPEIGTDQNRECINTKSLVFNYKYQSPDIVDFGFSAFANYRPSQVDSAVCRNASQLFVAASCQDLALKQIGTIFARETLTNPAGTGTVVAGKFVPYTGTYDYVGYYRILRALLPMLNFDRDKLVRQILLEPHPTPETNQNVVKLRVGNTFSESDPNLPNGKCSVLWHDMPDKPLVCLDDRTAAQYISANLVRNSGMEWQMLIRGRFLYVEFVIADKSGAPSIGGNCCFSRMEVETQLQTK